VSGTDDILPPYELALNYFVLGGEKSPGKCEIRGASREWEWAELAGWGLDGASLILRRRLLPEFEIDVRLTTQSDLDAWDDFYGKVLQSPVSGRKDRSRGVGIYHPRLARIGIGSVVILRVSQPVQGKGGSETFTIKLKEYRSPKFILTKPNGTIPGAAKKQPKAKDALDLAIEQETANVKRLSAADDALGSFSNVIGGG
jgi:hypothetical protein